MPVTPPFSLERVEEFDERRRLYHYTGRLKVAVDNYLSSSYRIAEVFLWVGSGLGLGVGHRDRVASIEIGPQGHPPRPVCKVSGNQLNGRECRWLRELAPKKAGCAAKCCAGLSS
jgi:hypothetical protein